MYRNVERTTLFPKIPATASDNMRTMLMRQFNARSQLTEAQCQGHEVIYGIYKYLNLHLH